MRKLKCRANKWMCRWLPVASQITRLWLLTALKTAKTKFKLGTTYRTKLWRMPFFLVELLITQHLRMFKPFWIHPLTRCWSFWRILTIAPWSANHPSSSWPRARLTTSLHKDVSLLLFKTSNWRQPMQVPSPWQLGVSACLPSCVRSLFAVVTRQTKVMERMSEIETLKIKIF